MSIEYPCIYFEKDGLCRKFTDGKFRVYCVMEPCPEQKLSNADKIRAMSDEEMATKMTQMGLSRICDIVCGGRDCKAIARQGKTSEDMCKEIIMSWLQQPAEEET